MIVRVRLAGIIQALALLLTAGAIAAEGADKPAEGQQPLSLNEMIDKGRASYAHRCSHCHGINMVSAGTVTYNLRTFPHDQRERFFDVVTNGKNNRMPPWGDLMSQEEIANVWEYIKTGGKL
jgi:cytochrome c55X